MAVVCPTCKYDLTGLPDGACPECGGAFTREGLARMTREVEAARAYWSSQWAWAPVSACAGVIMPLLVFLLSTRDYWPLGALLAACCGAWWTWARRKRWAGAPALLLVLLIPLAMLCWYQHECVPGLWQVACTAMIVCVAIGFAVAWTRRHLGCWMVLVACVPVAVRGAVITVHAINRSVAGYRWTEFDWEFVWNYEREYAAILVGDALWYGPSHIIVAASVVGACWCVEAIRDGRFGHPCIGGDLAGSRATAAARGQ